jgi:hypothetical protein
VANATSRAQSTTTPWETCSIKRNLSVLTATTYYAGTMIAINASGHAVKCDDTAGLRFDGLMADSQSIEVATTDTLGDKMVTVEKTFRPTSVIAADAMVMVNRKGFSTVTFLSPRTSVMLRSRTNSMFFFSHLLYSS